MALRVRDIKHVLSPDADVDPNAVAGGAKLDGLVFACGNLAQAALSKSPPSGLTDIEIGNLNAVIEGQSHSHRSIRCMVQGEANASPWTRWRLRGSSWRPCTHSALCSRTPATFGCS